MTMAWAWLWAGAALVLGALVAHHVRHLRRLKRWLDHPVAGEVPEGTGRWDEVLAALHRGAVPYQNSFTRKFLRIEAAPLRSSSRERIRMRTSTRFTPRDHK